MAAGSVEVVEVLALVGDGRVVGWPGPVPGAGARQHPLGQVDAEHRRRARVAPPTGRTSRTRNRGPRPDGPADVADQRPQRRPLGRGDQPVDRAGQLRVAVEEGLVVVDVLRHGANVPPASDAEPRCFTAAPPEPACPRPSVGVRATHLRGSLEPACLGHRTMAPATQVRPTAKAASTTSGSGAPTAPPCAIIEGCRLASVAQVTDGMVGDDRAAVVWAVFAVQTAAGKLVTERMSRGEEPTVTDELLVAIRAEWEAAGRPIVRPHTHRDEVTFADGTTVVGVRFLVDDPYKRDQAADVRALPRSALGPAVGPRPSPVGRLRCARCHRAARRARGRAGPLASRRARRGGLPRRARAHRHRSGVPRSADRNASGRGCRVGPRRVLREGGRDRRAACVRRRVPSGTRHGPGHVQTGVSWGTGGGPHHARSPAPRTGVAW